MSPYISLNMDTFAIVDEADYEKVKPYNWFLSGTGYAVAFVPVNGKFKLTYLHRFIMDAQSGQCVDHINGCSLDNLRLAMAYQNGQNRAGQPAVYDRVEGRELARRPAQVSRAHPVAGHAVLPRLLRGRGYGGAGV